MFMSDAQIWSESTLVRRCVAGERLAWRRLHRQLYPVARTFLQRMGVLAPDLDDACQDVFLQLFRALPGFRGEAEIKTWLYRLCATVAGRRRQRTDVTQAVLRLLAWRRADPPTCSPGDGGTEARLLEYALSRLRHSERLVFVLYELEGLSGKEIAQIVGIPEATVYTKLHYARRTFRAALGEGEAA